MCLLHTHGLCTATETIAFNDFIKHNGYGGAKEAGVLRLEGKEYVVQEGDVLLFRFNV
jgi:ribosome-binding ATPase YchF (GTP1/OBG family)